MAPALKLHAALLGAVLLAGGCDGAADAPAESRWRDGSTCGGNAGLPGIIALSDFKASGTPLVEGPAASVFANGDIVVSGTADLYGDVTSASSITLNGTPTITGSVRDGAQSITIASPDAEVAAAASDNDNGSIPCIVRRGKCNRHVSGSALSLTSTDTLTLPSGTYYFTSISINGKAQLQTSGNVVIYLDGPATINGGSTTDPVHDTITIISASDEVIKINGGAEATMHIFAPAAEINFSGTSGFAGSVVGNEVTLSGTTDVYLTHGNGGDDCGPAGTPGQGGS